MEKEKNHSSWHGLLMILCCILPILAIILLLPQLKSFFPGLSPIWLMLILCPLMHVGMMFMMRGRG